MRFLIYDRVTKFSRTFDAVFQGRGITIIRTLFRALKAIAFADPGCAPSVLSVWINC